MNERINELAEQAHSYACKYAQQPDYNPHNPYNQGMYKQRYDSKFAELIVRECAELATKEYNNRGAIHGNDLLQHFGVKE
jgi:hypothetical protein